MNSNNLLTEANTDRSQYNINQNWIQHQIQLNEKKMFENFNLSMSNSHEDDEMNGQRKKTSSRDPLSHRIIEKRRRDRMNNCLADLSRLIPPAYLKKSPSLQGRGRIEKTEIIEMAIKHMKHLQAHKYCSNETNCELTDAPKQDQEKSIRNYRLGYQECLSEAIRFLVEIEGFFTGDGLCQKMMDHLQNHMNTLDNVNACNEQQIDGISNKNWSSLPESKNFLSNSAQEKIDVNSNDMSNGGSTPLATSHLREMLESAPKQCSIRSQSRSGQSSPNSFSPSSQSSQCSNQNEVYNFKKDIKDRFQAQSDQKVIEPSINSTVDDERVSNSSVSMNTHSSSDHRSDTSGYSSNSSYTPSHKSSPLIVPAFALHPQANYYIPITIDASFIGKEVDLNSYPILYPINIAVNFNYQTTALSYRHMWPNMDQIGGQITPQLNLSSPLNHSFNNNFNNNNSSNNIDKLENDSKFNINLNSIKTTPRFNKINFENNAKK